MKRMMFALFLFSQLVHATENELPENAVCIVKASSRNCHQVESYSPRSAYCYAAKSDCSQSILFKLDDGKLKPVTFTAIGYGDCNILSGVVSRSRAKEALEDFVSAAKLLPKCDE